MLTPRSLVVAAVLAAAAGSLAAQGATIAAGSATLIVTSQASTRHGIAIDPHGVMWALVREVDSVSGALDLYLKRSTDGGLNWIGRFDTATTGDSAGSIAIGRGCNELHVVWSASNGTGLYDAYYQAFDVATNTWIGTPQQLTAATNSNDQYYGQDVQVTADDTLVVAISTHRGPPNPPWTSGWSAALLVRPPGAAAFDPLQQVNTDAYGQQIDLQVVGSEVHAAFRTNTGGYGTRYRGFDTATMQFTTPTDIQVDPGTSNVSNIAADGAGYLYVAYAKGGTTAGTGEIWVASAAPGSYGTWTPQLVASDPPLTRGNVADYNYTLCTDESGNVSVLYSKKNEQYQTLYFRQFSAGALATPELPLFATTDPDRFIMLCGVRNSANLNSLSLVVESRAAIHPGRLVSFVQLGGAGSAAHYGIACAGFATSAPGLRALGIGILGGSVSLEVNSPITNTAAALLVGVGCIDPPFDLGPIGMNGCTLNVASVASLTAFVGGTGTAQFSLAAPANPNLAGLALQFQAAVVVPGANGQNVLMSNAAAITLR